MSGMIQRLQSKTQETNERTRVIEMSDAHADEVLNALGSETSRETFKTLFESPGTATEIADRVDTSVQNVHYHLSNLEDADLIEQVDTVYSEKGNEMTVYGPATDPLVFVGDQNKVSSVRQSLPRIVSGLGILAAASLLVQWGAERLVRHAEPAGDIVGPASKNPQAVTPDNPLAWLVFEVVEPGVLFFFGTLLLVALVLTMSR